MSNITIDTAIVGGGQAVLAISYYLKEQGRYHVVLERASAVANVWRTLPTSQCSPEFLFDVDRDELPQHLRNGRH